MIDNNIFHNKKVAFHTLGCKLNFAETSAIGKKCRTKVSLKYESANKPMCV